MLHGAPSPLQVFQLEQAAPGIIEGKGSVFVYLGDTLGTSLRRVVEDSHPGLSILVGLALLVVLGAVFRGALPVRALPLALAPAAARPSAWPGRSPPAR